MARKPKDDAVEILKNILITQLAQSGLSQQSIREIVGCDIHRVNKIVRHLKSKTKKPRSE